MFDFNPQEILQRELDQSGTDVQLSDLGWPDNIERALNTLRTATRAAFVLYCIAIGFISIAFSMAFICLFLDGRLSAFVNIIVDWLAFVAMGIASALATVISVQASNVVNRYGNEIGIQASKGARFLIITWVATGLLLVASVVWCFDCIVGGKRRRARKARRNN